MKTIDPFKYFKTKHDLYSVVVIEFRGKKFEIYKKPTTELSGLNSCLKGNHFLINDTVKRSSKLNVVNWILKNA